MLHVLTISACSNPLLWWYYLLSQMVALLISDEKFIPLWPSWKYAGSKADFPKGRYQNADEAKGAVRRAGYRAIYEYWKASSITPSYPDKLPTPEAIFDVINQVFPAGTDKNLFQKEKKRGSGCGSGVLLEL